jgi:hypothetical protein
VVFLDHATTGDGCSPRCAAGADGATGASLAELASV